MSLRAFLAVITSSIALSACAPTVAPLPRDCQPTSNAALAAAARDEDECGKIVVAETALVNLAGLEDPSFGKHIVVEDNDVLVDTSQIRRAHKVTFGCNDALALIEAEASEVVIACAQVAPAQLRFLGGEYGNLGVSAAATSSLQLSCADESCAMSVALDIDDLAGTAFTLDGAFHIDLLIFTPLVDFAPLMGLAVPDAVALFGAQDLGAMRAYLAWLTERGFAGIFKHCPDEGECVDVALE